MGLFGRFSRPIHATEQTEREGRERSRLISVYGFVEMLHLVVMTVGRPLRESGFNPIDIHWKTYALK